MKGITCFDEASKEYRTEIDLKFAGNWVLYIGKTSRGKYSTHEERMNRDFMYDNQQFLTLEEREKDGMQLNVPNPQLGKKGFQQYISVLEKLLKTKSAYVKNQFCDIEWLDNQPNIKLKTRYVDFNDTYSIGFTVKNKYRLNFEGEAYHREFALRDTGVFDPNWHEHNESYKSTGISARKDELEKYIKDLIAEYEKVTGKIYIRVEVPFKERD